MNTNNSFNLTQIAMAISLIASSSIALASTTVHTEYFRGAERTYAVTIPDNCGTPDGVVFVLHGKGGSYRVLRRNGIDAQAERFCKIAVAPSSLNDSWNKDIFSADTAWIIKLINRYPSDRLSFIGHSAGATMSQVMHWGLGYGDDVVLSANTTVDSVSDYYRPFDGGNALLVMGKLDPFWDGAGEADRTPFLPFVNMVAKDSNCGKYEQTNISEDVILRTYSGCNVQAIVPMWMDHDWWEPLAEYSFNWLYPEGPYVAPDDVTVECR